MLERLIEHAASHNDNLVPREGDRIGHEDWNIIVLYWDGQRLFCQTILNAPEQLGTMAKIWAELDVDRNKWNANRIGVDISPLMAQWVREALTDGDS